ncbi:MAG TPA: hypothetical protein VH247_12160 [Thermoleophilaceae bacterium]|jgi:hypothetical protein|nr:hypothetical protein [Thermoleophilaceae bacterium]
MTPLLRLAVGCAVVLSLIAGAGCGSDTQSSKDYVSAVNKVQTDFASDVRKVGSSTPNGADPAAAAKKTFADLETAIDKAISDLKGVQAPDKVKSLHNELISEMEQFKSQVSQAGDSLNSKDPQAIVKAQTQFATSASTLGTKISQTIADINKQLQG